MTPHNKKLSAPGAGASYPLAPAPTARSSFRPQDNPSQEEVAMYDPYEDPEPYRPPFSGPFSPTPLHFTPLPSPSALLTDDLYTYDDELAALVNHTRLPERLREPVLWPSYAATNSNPQQQIPRRHRRRCPRHGRQQCPARPGDDQPDAADPDNCACRVLLLDPHLPRRRLRAPRAVPPARLSPAQGLDRARRRRGTPPPGAAHDAAAARARARRSRAGGSAEGSGDGDGSRPWLGWEQQYGGDDDYHGDNEYAAHGDGFGWRPRSQCLSVGLPPARPDGFEITFDSSPTSSASVAAFVVPSTAGQSSASPFSTAHGQQQYQQQQQQPSERLAADVDAQRMGGGARMDAGPGADMS